MKLFYMDDYKSCATPFRLGIKLNKECQYLNFDDTLYPELIDGLIYLTHNGFDICFSIIEVSYFKYFHEKATKKMQKKKYFVTLRVPPILVSNTIKV